MLIDAYTHILPLEVLREIEGLGPRIGLMRHMTSVLGLHDLNERFRAMDAVGNYRQIISLSNPPIETLAGPGEAPRIARIANDAMARLVDRHPDRFPAFVASLPMHDADDTLDELRCAVGNLGARGVQIFTNVNGHPLDEPQFASIFAAMAEFDLPIWLHPARTPSHADYSSEERSRFELWWCFGWPYETTMAMSRLALSGVFDRHPKLKIIAHHFGGMIPFCDKRIENGMSRLGSRSGDEGDARALSRLKWPLIDYFHRFYADTALFGASRGLRCGLDFFGYEHVVFASDAPFGPIAETRDAVADLDGESAICDAIFRRNIERLIGMDLS
ncbi:MAG: amidohydrolase family protein [Candidatus Acidiferrales bacterium]